MDTFTTLFLIGVFGFVIVIVALIGFLVNAFKNGRTDEGEVYPLTDQTWDTSVDLTEEVSAALDLYERSNIRIPKDIIEDASIHEFDTVERALAYIENQRNYWKLENQKKVLK